MINWVPERLERSESFGVKEEPPKERAFRSIRRGPRASPAARVAWGRGRAVRKRGFRTIGRKRVKGHALTTRRKRSKRARKRWGPRASPATRVAWGRGGARRREEFPLLRKRNRADFAHGKLGPRTTRAKRVVWGKGGAAQGASFRREAEAKQKGARRRE